MKDSEFKYMHINTLEVDCMQTFLCEMADLERMFGLPQAQGRAYSKKVFEEGSPHRNSLKDDGSVFSGNSLNKSPSRRGSSYARARTSERNTSVEKRNKMHEAVTTSIMKRVTSQSPIKRSEKSPANYSARDNSIISRGNDGKAYRTSMSPNRRLTQ